MEYKPSSLPCSCFEHYSYASIKIHNKFMDHWENSWRENPPGPETSVFDDKKKGTDEATKSENVLNVISLPVILE